MNKYFRTTCVGLLLIFTSAQAVSEPTFEGADASEEYEIKQHGKRLSHLLGCTGCHKENFTGGPFNQGWVAPNVSLKISKYDSAALDQAIRKGVALNGNKLRLMPSEMYQWLSDQDFKALEVFLRSLKPKGEKQEPFKPFPSDIAQWEEDGYEDANSQGRAWANAPGPLNLGPNYARGRYLARNLCTECHNNQLQGYRGFTPDLTIILAYNASELRHLLYKGKGRTRDQLGLMSLVSPARFPHLTDREYDDLTRYLRARAQKLTK